MKDQEKDRQLNKKKFILFQNNQIQIQLEVHHISKQQLFLSLINHFKTLKVKLNLIQFIILIIVHFNQKVDDIKNNKIYKIQIK